MNTNLKRLLNKSIKKISYYFLPLSFWILVIFGFDKVYIAVLTIISSLIHETGHLLALKNSSKNITPTTRGFKITNNVNSGYSNLIIVYLMGPLTNIFFGFLFAIFYGKSEYLFLLSIINFATAISNLLPIEGYDGYGIIKILLEKNNKISKIITLKKVSDTIVVLMVFFSLYIIGKAGHGYWIFLVFFISLITQMLKKYNRNNYREKTRILKK